MERQTAGQEHVLNQADTLTKILVVGGGQQIILFGVRLVRPKKRIAYFLFKFVSWLLKQNSSVWLSNKLTNLTIRNILIEMVFRMFIFVTPCLLTWQQDTCPLKPTGQIAVSYQEILPLALFRNRHLKNCSVSVA